ncbi:MAG: stage III sporulation protein AG [Lachnospiraceae bacterium]|nr:stage III sporulation protein AG [Lachnospiraceae bacterium]
MKEWLEKVKSLKKDQILILLLSGVLLLIIAMPEKETKENTGTNITAAESETVSNTVPDERERLELQLQNLLAQVEGVGRAQVMITLKSDGKKIVEKDGENAQEKEDDRQEGVSSSSQSVRSSESTVYQRDGQGNETPYVTERQSPEVDGVLVIAQGGGNTAVVQEITEAVMALFGVEAHKIKVMKME